MSSVPCAAPGGKVVRLTIATLTSPTVAEATAAREGERIPLWPTSDDLDPSTLDVLREFMLIGRMHRQLIHRAFTKQCLHPAQAMCVGVLAHHVELTQSELADALFLSRPSVTRLLQRMERGGLVERRTAEADQRQVIVRLTPAGLDLQHRLHAATTEYAAAALGRLPAEDRADLARILGDWRRLAEDVP